MSCSIEDFLSRYFAMSLVEAEWVASVEPVPEEKRWLVRLVGEEKDRITIWFTLRDRHLFHETGFMPHPVENAIAVYEYLLRLNHKQVGAYFSLGQDGGVFLVGAIAREDINEAVVDRVIGTVYETVENHFRVAMRLGFPAVFRK